MTAQIFISHARRDALAAQTICDALEQRGFGCWIAARDVEGGENFQISIVRAIRAAKVLILVFSENANNSDEIRKEIVLAGQNRLVVIPVRIEDVAPDEGLAYELATRQWIDFFEDRDAALQRLTRRLESIAGVTRSEPAAATAPNPMLVDATPGTSTGFRGSHASEETGTRLQHRPGAPDRPASDRIPWNRLPWRSVLAGMVGIAAIAGTAFGVFSLTAPRSIAISEQPHSPGTASRPSSSTPSAKMPALELPPTSGPPSSPAQPPNAANVSAKSSRAPPSATLSVSDTKTMLSRLGFFNGAINDYDDPYLRVAVVNFQRTNGLTADGVVAGTTADKLREAYQEYSNKPRK
jgi:hypothetical protein